MNRVVRHGKTNPLSRAAADGTLAKKLKRYIISCRPPPEGDPKRDGRLPNLAGFCSTLRCGTSAVEDFRREHPEEFDYVCAVLEDEALNSSRSPAIVNAYLKEKFWYDGKDEAEGEMRLIFDHDVLEDGE